MTKFNKQDISKQLQKSVKTVSFKKVNGEIRHMNCTLMVEYMPQRPLVTETIEPVKPPRKQNDATLSVWDVSAKGWRSFRIDSVFDVQDMSDETKTFISLTPTPTF